MSSSKSMPAYADIQRALTTAGLGIGVSEVHGSVSGYLVGGGNTMADNWLDVLQLQGEEAGNADLQALLANVAQATFTAIQPEDPSLELLLADGDDLEARALGLVDWCRGFLGGFGLAGADLDGMEPGMASILEDFADIAATEPEMGKQDEDAAALGELEGHVRFAALLLYAHLTVPEGTTRQ